MHRIIVVEDEPIVLSNIGDILQMSGLEPVLAYDGARAKELLTKIHSSGEPLPSLILSDLMMPNLDGYGLLEFVRQTPAFEHLPFVILSAKSDAADLKRAFLMGVTDYLVKPFEIDDLLSIVSKNLPKNLLDEDDDHSNSTKREARGLSPLSVQGSLFGNFN